MTLHLHHLTGCSPAPLAHYLKALGILRIVAEQKDPEARGFWQDEHFCLLTRLDRVELERFFLDDYAPTPFVSPWNKGSGFFATEDPALAPIERSTAARFAPYRDGIAAARLPLAALAAADATIRRLKDRTKTKKGVKASEQASAKALKEDPLFKAEQNAANRLFASLKEDLFTPCAKDWRGPHRDWLDAALVLPEAGKPSFPALLGTGGNDGRIDFTNNAMQRLADVCDIAGNGGPTAKAPSYLYNALWSSSALGVPAAPIGQFLPGSAGGANATTGPDGDALINPWDFILMLEGAVMFSSRSARRLDATATAAASAPFAVRSHPTAHGSVGSEKAERGEQWVPLWGRPTLLGDLKALFGEGRLQLGRRVAHRPLDVARAISRVGASRGVIGFVRFAYLERNGQSNFAVPVGRIAVHERPRARLVDDMAPWLDRVQRASRETSAPARLVQAERRLSGVVFTALTHDDSPRNWQGVLRAASAIEAIQATGTAYKAGPIPSLAPEWLEAADDGSTEWRLACALGSAAACYNPKTRRPLDSVRHHWLPLQPGAFRFAESDKRLSQDTRVVMKGRDAQMDLGALVQRRVIEAEQSGRRTLPLEAAPGYEADPRDIAALIAGDVDLDAVVSLARALMAIQWSRVRAKRHRERMTNAIWPDEAWIALRLASLPWPLDDGRKVPIDPAMLRRLASGDGAGAVDLALRRLRGRGFRTPLRAAIADEATARLWAASLAFPISCRSATRLAAQFEFQSNQENRQ